MDKAAVYESKKRGERPLFGGYYYNWPERSMMEQASGGYDYDDEEVESDLEELQELHMFNR